MEFLDGQKAGAPIDNVVATFEEVDQGPNRTETFQLGPAELLVHIGSQVEFLRGDCDGNGVFGGTPTEAIVGLTFTFRGGPEPPCLAACDSEANGTLNITDYVRTSSGQGAAFVVDASMGSRGSNSVYVICRCLPRLPTVRRLSEWTVGVHASPLGPHPGFLLSPKRLRAGELHFGREAARPVSPQYDDPWTLGLSYILSAVEFI